VSRVVILHDYFYPAYKAGGPIQSLVNMVDHLKDDICMQVICKNHDLDQTPLPVEANTWTNDAGRKVYYNSSGFKGIRKIAVKDSIFFINGIFSPDYNFFPILRLKGRKIISVRGMLHPEALAQKALKKKIYLQAWRILGLHTRCEFHATSEQEKEYIHAAFGKHSAVWVIQNLPNILKQQPLPPKTAGALRMATIALISPMKNHLKVIKALAKCDGEVTYDIYGPVKDAAYWKQCQAAMQKLPSNIQVVYHGELQPCRIPQVLEGVHVYIQPSKSENFGHSLYEALVAGRPVISSHNIPWTGLEPANAGLNVDPNDPNLLAAAMSRFVEMDSKSLGEWGNNARAYALAAIDVRKIKQQYLEMFSGQPLSAHE
jgi:glycosyltransferase involved in cell wall biosynthesis